MRRATWLRLALVLVTVVSAWLTMARLRLSPDLSALFPDRGEAAALGRFTRAFGASELGLFLLRGEDPEAVGQAAKALADALREKPSVVRLLDRAPGARELDPTLAWSFAGPVARARLADAVTPEGMRARLEETRALLLAPGSSEAEDFLARDPLRLTALPWEGRAELAAGVRASDGASFVTADGKARLVILQPRGSAFDPSAAAAFVGDANDAIAAAARPGVTFEVTGGHAIARATETLLKRDLVLSGVLSSVLASLMFLLTFRRARALLAVLPPLGLGTLWTMGLAAFWPGGLSAIAIAFGAVVVGVGVDTGVHVYAALLRARQRGLSPSDAAAAARRETWRPTMVAAIVAGLAFGSLALSDLSAVKQLGVLCGAGEILTAIAILLVTPEIGAVLERRASPSDAHGDAHATPGWIKLVAALTATRARAAVALAVSLAPAIVIVLVGWPRAGDALVALRPKALAPLVTQDAIYDLFGGRPGQWIVLSIDKDAERARARADAVAEALDSLAATRTIDGFDALATFAPSTALQESRLRDRDRLDLPGRKDALERALVSAGFDLAECAPALEAFAHPSHETFAVDLSMGGPLALIASRHLGAEGGESIAATFVRPIGVPEADARALETIHAADADAVVTGYAHLERALKESLTRDLPRVGLLSLGIATLALVIAFRSARDTALALGAVLLELCGLGLAMKLLHLEWHVYDALVVPVLIGITLDESMFLLHAAREPGGVARALRVQGPLVACTALTTAAGFGALLVCRFEGLRDLGAVGTLGVTFGLVSALVIVPAGLRLAERPRKEEDPSSA